MNSFKVFELKENHRFTDDLFLDKTFLLLNRGRALPQGLIQALREWQFTAVYCNGNLSISDQALLKNQKKAPERPVKVTPSITAVTEDVSMEEMGIEDLTPVGGRFSRSESSDLEKRYDFSHISDESRKLAIVQNVYNEFWKLVFDIYTRYATHKTIDLEYLSQKSKELCVFVKSNRRYVLQVHPNCDRDPKNFLVTHSLRSAVLAITVGLQLHMSTSKLIDLGTACILHEIGMIRLPSQLYLSRRALSPVEKNLLNTHPIISYTILKEMNVSLNICLAVLEHHEKENGTGYPRHIKNDKISLYAKIISVVCSFEAITSNRTYKEAASSFEAMVELLKNQTKQYDELVIKALLYSLSLFPVGSYVFLSNGKIGRVSDVNPENPKFPIVQLVNERDENGNHITIKTSDSGLRIVRVLNKQEQSDIVKNL
jgi:HD-GYP domain-containing protein (c-di-GMP phosphodiesterase class II)